MNINCEICGESINLANESDFQAVTCKSCGQRPTQQHIADSLEDPGAVDAIRSGDDSYERGHCCECDMNDSVVQTRDGDLVCSGCGYQHDEYEKCHRCGHNNTSDMFDSGALGCPVCGHEVEERLRRE